MDYSNNESGVCLIEGSQPAVQSGNFDECGGTVQFIWEFTDNCNRTIQHIQNVTVEPAPEAFFINPPGPTTLNCSEIPATPPPLNYSNNQLGACEISGTVNAIQSGSYNSCGGNITYTWVFTDDCNRTINHTQNVTVNPSSDPSFTILPDDISINCGESPPPPINLPYTNDETGPCEIAGTVSATITIIDDLTTEYFWIYTNPCNNATITHTQVISETPTPEITLTPNQATICEGDFFDLSTIIVNDGNGTNFTVTYHSGTPAGPGNQLPSSNVNPSQTTVYFVLATNDFNCTDEEIFTVIVEEPPYAGEDGISHVCNNLSGCVNLFDFLNGNPAPTGQWVDNNNYGINVSNPFCVDFTGFPADLYSFNYVMPSIGVCPDDIAVATVELLPEVEINILSIQCSGDPNFYEILVNSNGFNIAPNQGTVTEVGNNEYLISDIPITSSINIVVFDALHPECVADVSINPPDCDCPDVDPPVSNGDAEICEGEPTPELSVTVGPNETANWYSDASGTNLLLDGSTTYTPDETTPGVYVYYVEAENLNDGCVSLILTPVQLEIFENPSGDDAQLEACDDDTDGFVTFDLTDAESLISPNLGYSFAFYETLEDAQNQINELPTIYTNTSTPTQDLFVIITDQNGCVGMVMLTLVVNELPTINLSITDETCLGDEDGSVNIDSPEGVNFSLDSITWTTQTAFNPLAAGNYTIYSESADGCIASEDFEIMPGLELELVNFEINCDDNGTASDASDDFYTITFNLSNTIGSNSTYTVNDENQDYGPFDYNTTQTLTFPANGQIIELTFSDDQVGCPIQQTIGPLNSCSTNCSISINVLDFECSDNGTPSDASDDIYTITINASAINGSSNNTYNVLIDGILNFNFEYDINVTFTLPANGNSPLITVEDNEDSQCQDSQGIGPLTPCSNQCVIEFTQLSTVCNDNGTVSNQDDDFYEITTNASAINGSPTNNFIVFVDGNETATFEYGIGGVISIPADGSSPIITIVDETDDNCSAEQQIGPLDPCTDECTINASYSNIDCDDEGTNGDSTDDTFTFDLTVSGQNVSNGWISEDGNYSGDYGQTISLGPFLIADGDVVIIILDNENPECTDQTTIPAPPPCSDPCVITLDQLDVVCNDNGTASNQDDDFYEITINATATNPGPNNNFQVLVDGTPTELFAYGIGGTFTLPADGSSPVITVVDETETYCFAEQQIGPLDPCTDECTISASITNIECDNQGTDNDPNDDTYTFDLLVSGQNVSNSWMTDDGNISGTYGDVISLGPFLISDGDVVLIILDDGNPACTTQITATAPPACSDPCEINFALLEVICNDNGTVADPSDDFYDISVNATATYPGPNNNFQVLVDAVEIEIFEYGIGGTFTIPANGNSPVITVIDETETYCFAEQQIGPLDPCNGECEISAVIQNILCNDQGTGLDPNDDTYTFEVIVSGQNTSSGWFLDDASAAGDYDEVVSFGPYLISDGDISLTILDGENSNCSFEITATAPPPCSDACEINFTLLNVLCNDNGTVADQSDDFYEITIDATATNGGPTNNFEVFVDGMLVDNFEYGTGGTITIPADNSSSIITIVDETIGTCSAEQQIGPLIPCTDECVF